MGKQNNPDKKVGFGKLVLWNTSAVSVAVATLLMGFVTIFCTDTLGLEPFIVGAVFAASKVLDSVTDLMAGFIIDRTKTKWGKGRPYEIFMLILWVCTWLLFSVPENMSTTVKYVWVFFMYILMNAICVTFLNANNVVYMVRAFKTREQQTRVVSYGAFFTMGAGLIFNVAFPIAMAKMATTPAGWSRLIGMIAIPMTAIGILRMLFIKEEYNSEADVDTNKLSLSDVVTLVKTNKGFLSITIVKLLQNMAGGIGAGVYYFTWIIGNVGLMGVIAITSVIGLPLAFIMPAMREKIGMKKMSIYGFVIALAGYIMMFFAKDNLIMVVVASLISSIAVVPFTMLFNMFIVDCADYNEMIGKPRMEATIGSITGLGSKLGGAIGGMIMGLLLSLVHYDGTALMQPDSVIMMIRIGSSVVPAIIFLAMILVMRTYKLDDILKSWRAENAERN